MEVQTIKATKKEMNKLIKWSSSKHCEQRKSDVVNQIIFSVEKGEDTEYEFRTGSYSERGHLCGWGYTLKIKDGMAILTENRNEIKQYQLEKPTRNRMYTNAKRIKITEAFFDSQKSLIGNEYDVLGETVDVYYFSYTNDGKVENTFITKKLVEVIK